MEHFILFFFPLRKGPECHAAMLSGILAGMPLQADDRITFVDVLPNELLDIKNRLKSTHIFSHSHTFS